MTRRRPPSSKVLLLIRDKTGYTEGHNSGYTEGCESILEILDAINRGNDTVEKLTALGYDAKTAQEVLEKK